MNTLPLILLLLHSERTALEHKNLLPQPSWMNQEYAQGQYEARATMITRLDKLIEAIEALESK